MLKKIIFFLIFILVAFLIFKKLEKEKISKSIQNNIDDIPLYYSNVIKDINYTTTDLKGNVYTITASEGEIDLNNSDVIFLKKVIGVIKLKNSENINISSKFGKYNMKNLDTIFSKDVVITYQDNKVIGENLDYSMIRGTMIISRNVVFTNQENILKADTIEINTASKDTKIYMYDLNKKVNVINNNSNGSN
jgi:lipopolysaccharide export system protein LptA